MVRFIGSNQESNSGRLLPDLFAVLICSLLVFSYSPAVMAQKATVSGVITDLGTGDPLPYSNLLISTTKGITADGSGNYSIQLDPGDYIFTFSHVGYETLKKSLKVSSSQIIRLDAALQARSYELDQTVISAGRYEQKLSDINLSMAIIKPAAIEATHSWTIDQAIDRVPAVDIVDGQANIRNGSGWSYGAGSRVMVLLDDLPILTGDAADVKWALFPTDNIGQIEIVKGASSALYGSSALNGVMNVRSAWPESDASTKVNLQSGIYLAPKRKELLWRDEGQALYGGAGFYHLGRKGSLDYGIGGNVFNDPGYRKDNFDEKYRFELKLRNRDRKVKGLNYGFQSGFMQNDIKDFFLWQDADSGAWKQNPQTISRTEGMRLYIDPFINYYRENGSRHSLKSRFYRTTNFIREDEMKDNSSSVFFGEYQYYRKFWDNLDVTAGLSGNATISESNLFGDHHSNNIALFAQADRHFKKLSLSLGFRWEHFRLDTVSEAARPVIRTGINYKTGKQGSLRASFGQGYRFPSIAEKYTYTSLGGVNIFPNPRIESESGWSAEAGFKQGIQLGEWQGYIDIAGFWTEYNDMMEFVFDFYDTLTFLPTTEYYSLRNMGFQSQNIGLAQISGIDFTIAGKGNILGIPFGVMLGYTYTNPLDKNQDPYYQSTKSSENDILKYRYYHSFKGDIEISHRKFTGGINFIYRSFMINVDKIFVDPVIGNLILPGYGDYREENQQGYFSLDLRAEYRFTKSLRASLMMRNATNRENIGRPGDLLAPRTLSVQMSASL